MAGKQTSIERLSFKAWPEPLQRAWRSAVTKTGLPPAKANPARRALEDLFRQTNGSRPSIEDLDAYWDRLVARRTLGGAVNRLRHLYDGLLILWPDEDWSWVNAALKDKRKIHWAAHPQWSVNSRKGPKPQKDHRLCLTLSDWPQDLLEKWEALLPDNGKVTGNYRPAGPTSPFAGLSGPYIARLERGYGRYLAFALPHDLPQKPTAASVEAFVAYEEANGSAPISIYSYVFEIWRVATCIWSKDDWDWLINFADALKASAKPVRPQMTQSITAGTLRRLGADLMEEAHRAPPTARHIVKFRDGLIITLLTHKPMRVRNLSSLLVDDIHFDDVGGVAINLGPTKNGRPDTYYCVDADLAGALKFWIDDLRPRLGADQSERGLWIGLFGNRLKADPLSQAIKKRTKAGLDTPVSPHKFRNAVAMIIARHDPEMLPVATRLLGHRDAKSVAPYEGVARSTGAADLLENILVDYRVPPAIKRKPQR